ncbi:hypothetical protein L1049_011800 [Liquidambar formosana]|uniref:Uncharacterized protein n=1 Tax=Liquidambar formosana TaxID=63359 RepID=A0AAP0X2K3_LIQFO
MALASFGSYLQLRSRRLEKQLALVAGHDSKRQRRRMVTSGLVGCLNKEGQSTKEKEATQKVEGMEEEIQEVNNNNNIDGVLKLLLENRFWSLKVEKVVTPCWSIGASFRSLH